MEGDYGGPEGDWVMIREGLGRDSKFLDSTASFWEGKLKILGGVSLPHRDDRWGHWLTFEALMIFRLFFRGGTPPNRSKNIAGMFKMHQN